MTLDYRVHSPYGASYKINCSTSRPMRPTLWAPGNSQTPAQNTWGNVERRGLLTGPAYVNLDAPIVKIIRFGTRRAEIRADFFNALNIAHYANPSGTLGNATSAASRTSWHRPSA